MDKAADDALIRGYRRHERLFPLTDAKGRHVAAAAFRAGLRAAVDHVTILTWNIKNFDRAEKTFDECVDALAAQGLKRLSEALKGLVA